MNDRSKLNNNVHLTELFSVISIA